MTQRTFNIILCCKNTEAGLSRKEDVINLLCRECNGDKEDYTDSVLSAVLEEAICDYIDGCEKPSSFIRSYIEAGKYIDSEIDKILSAFAMTQIRRGKEYINGFNDKLFEQEQ